jgi:predicted DNA-binding transcriptional regulator AlpA
MIPETGFLPLHAIIGRDGITPTQAEANRRYNEDAAEKARKAGRLTKAGAPRYTRRPTTPRPAVIPLVPVKRSTWWAGVRSGRFPAPIRLGPHSTAWRAEDVRELIARLGSAT